MDKPVRRKTTALDRAVLRYQKGKKKSFSRIYHEIYPTISFVARRFVKMFPDRNIDDLIQEAYLHISMKVIPKYNPDKSGFKTLVRISVTNKFRSMLRKLMENLKDPEGIPVITFTEWELNSSSDPSEIAGSNNMLNDILISDFLQLFKDRLTKESWSIYWRLYRDPNCDFKNLASSMGISTVSLYRKSRSIYAFLKMLIEKELDDVQ